MNSRYHRSAVLSAALAATMTSGVAIAEQQTEARDSQSMRETSAMDGQEQVNEALRVVNQMKKDPQLTNLLERARGVYIAPDFAKAAVGVGGRGGEGVLLIKQDGQWSGPAFYNFGRVSAGLQAGAEAGSVAMLLMTEDAVRPFTSQENNFSLDAAAGLTVVDYSAQGRSTAGEPDVITWSDSEGLFAGASIGVTGFTRDEDENHAYYRKQATPQQIFSGSVNNPHADVLKDALPTRTASR